MFSPIVLHISESTLTKKFDRIFTEPKRAKMRLIINARRVPDHFNEQRYFEKYYSVYLHGEVSYVKSAIDPSRYNRIGFNFTTVASRSCPVEP